MAEWIQNMAKWGVERLNATQLSDYEPSEDVIDTERDTGTVEISKTLDQLMSRLMGRVPTLDEATSRLHLPCRRIEKQMAHQAACLLIRMLKELGCCDTLEHLGIPVSREERRARPRFANPSKANTLQSIAKELLQQTREKKKEKHPQQEINFPPELALKITQYGQIDWGKTMIEEGLLYKLAEAAQNAVYYDQLIETIEPTGPKEGHRVFFKPKDQNHMELEVLAGWVFINDTECDIAWQDEQDNTYRATATLCSSAPNLEAYGGIIQMHYDGRLYNIDYIKIENGRILFLSIQNIAPARKKMACRRERL